MKLGRCGTCRHSGRRLTSAVPAMRRHQCMGRYRSGFATYTSLFAGGAGYTSLMQRGNYVVRGVRVRPRQRAKQHPSDPSYTAMRTCSMSDCTASSHTSSLSAPFAAAVCLPDFLRVRLCELGRRILPAWTAQIPPPPLPMLPVLVTQPVAPTNGMVETTLPVVSAKPVVPTLPVVQIHVPLLPGAADIAAVARASALAYLSAFDGNGSSENTGGIRCGIARSGGALLGGTFWASNGTPCCGSSTYSCNGTFSCCS